MDPDHKRARLHKVAACMVWYHIFGSGEGSTDFKRANGHFVPYCIVLLLDLRDNRSVRVKSSFEIFFFFFGSVPLHFQIYKYGLLLSVGHVRAKEALDAIVAVITEE